MVEPGVVINDRFRVVKIIGEGGMGAVFEGEHTGVGRKVAIKVLHPEYAKNSEIVGRFQREARSAAAIGHDNIIEVLDFGVHEGAPYMVMEFLKGESLGGRMESQGPVPIGSAAYIMTQMLAALAAAHAVGIIHRDLKPDNVFLITKAGHRDFVKLLDFGIAKLKQDDNKPESKGLTQTGAVMGTPYYMAPEQALGKRELDHRADIYSAGVMLYQMVTGQVPFDAESQAELLMAIVYRINGLKSPREINPEIPPEFEAIILKAMDKDAANRYADAGEFGLALEPFVTLPGISSADQTGSIRTPVGTAKTLTPASWEKPAIATQPDGSRVDPTGSAPGAVSPPVAVPAAVAKSRTGLYAAIGGVAILGILGAIVVPRLASPTPPVRTVGATTATPPVVTPATVALDIDGVPSGATLLVDGQPAPSPHLTFQRGSAHTIRVTAPGKLAYERAINADRDRSITIALADEPVVVAVAPVAADAGNAAAEPAVAQTHGRGAHRAATGGAAPAGAETTTTGHSAGHTGTAHGNGNPLLPVSNEF